MAEVKTITADLKLTFPIRYAENAPTRKEGESDELWEMRSQVPVLEPLIWAYHTPVSRPVFEANYRAIAAANASIFSNGLGAAGKDGPIIATLALRDAAKNDALSMGRVVEGDPALPLLAELKRLTLVLAPGVGGYEYLPVDIALQKQVINAEDWTEAESALVFFTCGLWMERREYRTLKRLGLASVLRGSITSLDVTALCASFGTLTTAGVSASQPRSLVPS